jgi:uncharacterized protein (DUF2235 family)
MAKRLVVCCDGTWNQPEQTSHGIAAPTNVAKVALAIAREDAHGMSQRVHYEPGVGTRRFERIRGGAFGFGLSRNVRNCYRFLVENYKPGDELFFFGFSRGAFTARSTVGLVRNSGILRDRDAGRIGEAYRLYRARADRTKPSGIEAQLFRRMYSHPDTRITFVGVWDTVGSLGIPLRLPVIARMWEFHDTDLSTWVDVACHALAIDERRKPFRPALWHQQADAPASQELRQVWFTGVHSDVGGGYEDPSLAEIPLLWMVDRARSAGLEFVPDRLVLTAGGADDDLRHQGVHVMPSARGRMHDSFTGVYPLLGSFERVLEKGGGFDADGSSVASSAAARYGADSGYRPSRLGEYIDAKRATTEVEDGG